MYYSDKTDAHCSGYAYGLQKLFVEAVEYYEKAIQINPKFRHAYLKAGYIYSLQGKVDKTIQYLLEAIQLQPEDRKLYSLL